MKNPLKTKGSWIGLLVTIFILVLTGARVPVISHIVQWVSQLIMDMLCPSGGLECLGLAFPLLALYLLLGFFTGYFISVFRNRRKK